MYIIIAYSIICFFYIGIILYRIKNRKFNKYINEHTGFIFIFILLSLIMEAPIALKALYVFLVLCSFIYGRLKKD